MSRFFSSKFSALQPYTPGEQPQDMQYIKLNTNESPFPPSQQVIDSIAREGALANLYCDPECTALRRAMAGLYGLQPEQVMPVNGSDEILNFAFMAFCDETHPIAYADITYGCYPVFAQFSRIPSHIIPLKEDFSIDYRDYCGLNETIVLANPNAPTGLALPPEQIEEILKTNPNHVVIVDEAYVAFGAQSCIPLLSRYDNLLVCQTFSKSHCLAGARLGFGFGSPELLEDIHTIKYSTNPYNVNRMTQGAGIAAVQTNDYYLANCRTIEENRAFTTEGLQRRGFTVLPSQANFVFARCERMDGGALYRQLKARGVLVRHFSAPRITPYVRITIGTRQQMERLLEALDAVLKEA